MQLALNDRRRRSEVALFDVDARELEVPRLPIRLTGPDPPKALRVGVEPLPLFGGLTVERCTEVHREAPAVLTATGNGGNIEPGEALKVSLAESDLFSVRAKPLQYGDVAAELLLELDVQDLQSARGNVPELEAPERARSVSRIAVREPDILDDQHG